MTPVLHIELVEQTTTALQLRFWRDNPNTVQTRTLALPDISDLISKAETDYYSPSPAKLQEIGQRLFRWLDGGERWLTGEIQAVANQAPTLVLAIAMPHRLAHLPWEVLHDGTTYLLHAHNPAVLPMRWRNVSNGPHRMANRPLQALFMASSPENVQPMLDYEHEEAVILKATERRPLDLTVEESGCLEELGALLQDYGVDYFDLLHFTGHADHNTNNQPIFLLENSEGKRADATAAEIVKALPHRPPLVFLSGCRTGQNAAHGEIRSLAEQLIDSGFRAVLGWGRPVRDTEATLAAEHLYQQLAAGEALAFALVRTHLALFEAGARDWHLLRLFCAGDPPDAFVTPVKNPGRKRPVHRAAESEFLDPLTRTVKVATRASFVGRRRLLQRSLRQLRESGAQRVGLLLHGQGGRGKSSVAARLCDRLRRDFQRVVVIGRLDETALINAWAPELLDDAHRQALRDPGTELRFRIEAALKRLSDEGRPAPLFVLDDFEQNQPRAADGDLQLTLHAAGALLPLFDALNHSASGRLLITSRYALPAPFAGFLHDADVPPLDANEQAKQSLRLDQKAPRPTKDDNLLGRALAAADGNPRLFEWLHSVLERPGLDHIAILAEMQQAEEQFREQILARRLIGSLTEESRLLLGQMLVMNVPVPFAAVQALDPTHTEIELREALAHASALSLIDITDEEGQPHYRVPHQLGGATPPLLAVPIAAERADLVGRVFDVLYQMWWMKGEGISESRILELIQLASEGGSKANLLNLARVTTNHWIKRHRHRETVALLEPLLDILDRHYGILMNLARSKQILGMGDEAGALFKEAVRMCEPDQSHDLILLLLHHTDWLAARGELEEVLRVCRNELLPLTTESKDERHRAMALGKIADVLEARGELDEALSIRQEELLPVFERLDDVRERAVTLGKIADVLAARGELDEALRIRREEELLVYERLGDVLSRAMTLGKIADVLVARGELDEALRILREELLPVFERLGDVRSGAVAQGQIADVLAARGELDEALRIRREEELPVYERLGDVRSRAITLGKIADMLAARGELDEALRILREELLPVFERLGDVRSRAVTLGKIADVLVTRGELDEALRIRREEELPVYERLGDVRERAVTLGKIADVLVARGELDEALRILREELLPVFERLGDVRSRAVTLGKIADVLTARRELDEALRIRREEELPVYERLGDARSRALTLGRIADVLAARGELGEALRIRREEELPVYERLGDVRSRAVTLGQIADVLAARGELDEALRILREEELPVYERLGDVHSLILGRVKFALILLNRGREEDISEAVRFLIWAYQAAVQRGYKEAGQIADILQQLGLPVPTQG